MSKFRVGDRVRILKDSANCAVVRSGDTGLIVGTEYDGYKVEMDKLRMPSVKHWGFTEVNLELVNNSGRKLKAGDWIAYTGPISEHHRGFSAWFLIDEVHKEALYGAFYTDILLQTRTKTILPFSKDIKIMKSEKVLKALLKDLGL